MSATLIEKLRYFASETPEAPALKAHDLSLTYRELALWVQRQANEFSDRGIQHDSIVGVQCADDVRHLVMVLALSALGATSCTIPSHERSDTQQRLKEGVGVSHTLSAIDAIECPVLASSSTLQSCESILLFATSGTTGEPKLVEHQSSGLVAQAHRHINSVRERFACVATMEHNFAKRHRLYCLAMGATNVFLSHDPKALVKDCLLLGVNVLHVSAFQAQELVALCKNAELASVRLKLGGSHVAPALREQLREHVTKNLQAGYGTTETGAIAFTDPWDVNAADSVGKPLPGIEIFTVDKDGKRHAEGEPGEFVIRCEGMFSGYWGRSDITAERLKDGCFYTGDIGRLDAEGRIYVSGRTDDMFVFNSMNIFPQDIEAVIKDHPSVADAAVVPKPSKVHGNIPVALIQYKPNVKQRLADVELFVKARAGVRAPRQYLIVESIPKTPAGKLSRRALSTLPSDNAELRTTLIDRLSPNVRRRIKRRDLEAFISGEGDIVLKHLEMDSLDRMEFLIVLETEFDTVIAPQDFVDIRYFGTVVSRVMEVARSEAAVLSEGSSPTQLEAEPTAPPKIIRYLRRLDGFCNTTVHFTQLLTILRSRLTPKVLGELHEWQKAGHRLLLSADQRREQTARAWLSELIECMAHAGEGYSQDYVAKKVNRSAILFYGQGERAGKTLIVCFPPAGARDFLMPTAALLNVMDASRFDLLMLSDPERGAYHQGIPWFGPTLGDVFAWLSSASWFKAYGAVRTLGFSAGSFAALAASGPLNAELAVSVSGRFHSRKRLLKNMRRLVSIWRGTKVTSSQVILSYAADNTRDTRYARLISRLTGGRLHPVAIDGEKVGHYLFHTLLQRKRLPSFLEDTILS